MSHFNRSTEQWEPDVPPVLPDPHPNSVLGRARSGLAAAQKAVQDARELISFRQSEASKHSSMSPDVHAPVTELAFQAALRSESKNAVISAESFLKNCLLDVENAEHALHSVEHQLSMLVEDLGRYSTDPRDGDAAYARKFVQMKIDDLVCDRGVR